MLRKYLMVLVVTLLSVISPIGFTTAASEQKEEAKYVPDFKYTPESQAAPGSAGVTFAVANALYQTAAKDTKPWFMYPQFDNLHKAVAQDLTKLLAAKGFSVHGPFDSYDLIPYPDKKAVDLYLVPTIELSFKTPEEAYSIEDIKIEVNGTMYLKMLEIFTRELMWAKSIPFRFEFPCMGTGPYLNVESIHWGGTVDAKNVNNKKINKPIQSIEIGPYSMNEIAKGIEKEYPNLMDTISKMIDPEEMQILKKQCQELKSKKGY